MNRLLLTLTVGAAATIGFAAPASAQYWQPINQRQANLDARIDQGIRSGALTRNEAIGLRGEFRTLARLEARYRATGGGLSGWERTDLERRFDGLSARVYGQKHDFQGRPPVGGPAPYPLPGPGAGPAPYPLPGPGPHPGGWLTINQRQARLDARIDAGIRQGTISRREAILLRGDFRTLANLEANYRRTGGGLTPWERQDLDRRFDRLSARIRIDRTDYLR